MSIAGFFDLPDVFNSECKLSEWAKSIESKSLDCTILDKPIVEDLAQHGTLESLKENSFIFDGDLQPEAASLTTELNAVQEATHMSDATMKSCTISDSGVAHLKCINEALAGQIHETADVPYVEKIVDVNGVGIEITMPEFPAVFETVLPKDKLLESDAQQFKHCNEQLRSEIKNNPDLAEQFTSRQLNQINYSDQRTGALAPITPEGYTWHHAGECGKMQLVNTALHAEARHTGGKAIWGGGRI